MLFWVVYLWAMEMFSDEWFMREALREAQKAFDLQEVPVGAVVVSGHRIIARAHNLTEQLNDVTAHAEMQAITAAANFLGAKYLTECRLFVTLEPCPMCAGAIRWARPVELVYGAADLKYGFDSTEEGRLHPKTKVKGGVYADACGLLRSRFFQERRR